MDLGSGSYRQKDWFMFGLREKGSDRDRFKAGTRIAQKDLLRFHKANKFRLRLIHKERVDKSRLRFREGGGGNRDPGPEGTWTAGKGKIG